jgi:prepilin-type N-terminal cleavage/methylation domain-containing protein
MCRPPDRASVAGGFTLIEALVALVILAAGLLVFYEFLGSSLRAADRARDAAEEYDRDRNALALASTLNPMATPDGTFGLGAYRIRWHAERITAPRRGTGFPFAGEGPFTVALYRIVLDFPDDRQFAPMEVTKLGYHRETASGPPSAEPVN